MVESILAYIETNRAVVERLTYTSVSYLTSTCFGGSAVNLFMMSDSKVVVTGSYHIFCGPEYAVIIIKYFFFFFFT